MAAPTFVAEYEAAWNNTTTPKTVSATAAAGDVFIVVGGSENANTLVQTPTGGTSITWTQQEAQSAGAGNQSHCILFTASPSAQSWTLSAARSATANWWGFNALRFSGSTGIGAHTSTNNGTSAGLPTVNLTTTGANSSIVAVIANWNGGTAEPTWGAINGYTPTVANGGTVSFFGNTANYAISVAIYPDVGAAGSKTISQSAPTGQRYVIAAIEVLGSGGTPATFTANAGDAAADGASATFTGAAAFSATAGDAAASGGSSAFTATAMFASTAGDATADGTSSTFTGAALFSGAAGDAAGSGGSTSFAGAAVFASTVGDAAADGSTATFSAGATATFTTTVGDATADGSTAAFTAAAVFSATAGDASADGGSTSFAASALFATTAGAATGDGGSSSFTAAALFAAVAGDASADGSSATFIGGSASTFTALVGDATASGGTGTFTAPATFAALAGDAAAAGSIATFFASAAMTALVGNATAAGGTSTFTGAAAFVTTAGDAPASGGVCFFVAGEIPVSLEQIGTHRERSHLGTHHIGALGVHREIT